MQKEAGTTIPYLLKRHLPDLKEKYGVKTLELFGSCAREEMSPESNVNLLVEFEETPDLLEFLALEEYLQSFLKRPVDLVPKRKLKNRIRQRILNEAVAV